MNKQQQAVQQSDRQGFTIIIKDGNNSLSLRFLNLNTHVRGAQGHHKLFRSLGNPVVYDYHGNRMVGIVGTKGNVLRDWHIVGELCKGLCVSGVEGDYEGKINCGIQIS